MQQMKSSLSRQEIFNSINSILAEWDPIGVGEDIASDEYTRYVPEIVRVIEARTDLYVFLKDVLVRQMELPFDESDARHVDDLRQVTSRIQSFTSGASL